MWQKIKQWPVSMKLAVVWIAIIWTMALFAWPPIIIALTVLVTAFLSVIRVVTYLLDGH